jgi:hypothetical protein
LFQSKCERNAVSRGSGNEVAVEPDDTVVRAAFA